MIQTKNLIFKYGSQPVLNGIDVSIEQGEYVCIIGSNGGRKIHFCNAFKCYIKACIRSCLR